MKALKRNIKDVRRGMKVKSTRDEKRLEKTREEEEKRVCDVQKD